MRVAPYVLHTTYVFGGPHGKRSRLREARLWLADPPAYFDGPRFLSMELRLPPVRPGARAGQLRRSLSNSGLCTSTCRRCGSRLRF